MTDAPTAGSNADGHERRERALTEADIKALADELEDRLVRRFYTNLGRGLWGLIWRAFMLGMLGLAACGGMKNHGG
jgi:hypothetical protein